jgi:hypothetical protein
MKKKLVFGLIAVIACSMHAQSFVFTGTVVDERGGAIIGVSITVKDTSIGTVTGVDGKFSLTLPDLKKNNIAVFSFIGCETQEYRVDEKSTNVKIIMKESAGTLSEVVVSGYHVSEKRAMSMSGSMSGSVSRARSVVSKDKAVSSPKTMPRRSEDEIVYTESEIKSGTLTAGEVSDFAKWHLWSNILVNNFNSYLNIWKFRPLERYMAQLTNQQGMPLANAEVTLQNEFGDTLWKTKTDNTGKAELWTNFFSLEKADSTGHLKLVFEYEGKKVELAAVTPFEQGINTAQIDADCTTRNKVDLFFIVDATGSMGDEIRYLQAELADIINKVHQQQSGLQLRTGSLVYRDNGDEYLTRKSSLDSDVSKTLDFLKAQRAGGGGDTPEAVDEALYESIENESWDDQSLARIAFIVLDAPSHNDADVIKRLAAQIRLAAEKGIRIVPIACSDIQKDGEYLMRTLALATNGTYLFLTDDSGVGKAHIKPTTDKYEVEKLNDAIVRVVKQYTQMPDCSNKNWVQQNTPPSETDKFVPNPYDENPEKDLSKVSIDDLLKIYPNPCEDVLKIEVKEKDVRDVYFVDMTGKTLLGFKSPAKKEIVDVNVQNLSTGIYFVKVNYKGKWFAQKIIVKR